MTVAKTAFSRVFLTKNRASPSHKPVYESMMKAGALDFATGDIERIEAPDPQNYGKFIEVGEVQGAEGRPTIDLMGRFSMSLASTLLEVSKSRCEADVAIGFGMCKDPRDWNEFTKKIFVEKARSTNYSTDELGALASDENAKIDETASISGRNVYEFMPLGYTVKAGDIVTNQVVDVIILSSTDCDDCGDGCQRIFGVTLAAGGSPSTHADVVYSLDGGSTWYAHDIDSFATSSDASGIAKVNNYIAVISNDENAIAYALLSEFAATGDPDFTNVGTGFVTAKEPNAISSTGNMAYIVGDGGYVYKTEDATTGVTVLDAGTIVTDDLNAVHALSNDFALAAGNAGAILYIRNDVVLQSPSTPVGVSVNLNTCFAKTEDEWWVGGSNGSLYYTENAGVTWTEKAFPGSGSGVVRDIKFTTDSIAYLAHDTSATRGRILESVSGGYDFIVAPRGVGTLPLNDQITALAVCPDDPNFVVGVGLADDGSDGFVIIGED